MEKTALLHLKIKKNYCFGCTQRIHLMISKFRTYYQWVSNLCSKWYTFTFSSSYTRKGWKHTENLGKIYRAISTYLYCVKHLQRVAFGTMKFNRLMQFLGFISSQLCSNAILSRSCAVCYCFQLCVTQILMIC